jgi:hypothetical protein
MLPNKIRATMGIIADVNLMTEGGKEYILHYGEQPTIIYYNNTVPRHGGLK